MASGMRLGAVRRKEATAEGVRWGNAPSETVRGRGGREGGREGEMMAPSSRQREKERKG